MTVSRLPLRPPPLSWRWPLTAGFLALTAVALTLVAIASISDAFPQPVDVGVFAPAGAALLQGQWAAIFSDSFIQAGPFELAFWGIAELLHVQTALQWQIFVVIGSAVAGVVFGVLVERILRPITPVWSPVLAAGATFLGAVTAMLTTSVSSGHPAEIAVPLLWLGSGMLARRDKPFTAAVLLGLSTGWELWGVLGAAVLLLAPRIDLRMLWRSAVGVLVPIAFIFLPFVLLGPFEMFSFHWLIYPGTLAQLLFPDATTFSWPMRMVQAALSLGGGAAAALLLRRRTAAIWLVPLASCAIRLFLDPVDSDYYRVPPIALVITGLVLAIAQVSVPVFLASVVLLNLIVDFHQPKALIGGLLVLAVAGTVALVARDGRESDDALPRRRVRGPIGAAE
ncbi:MAG TPA: hypothetical protein VFQ74_02700 [Pseudolysinimonas sp.]|nr:hypothetical protein [Pseudolysinimonas sp.]